MYENQTQKNDAYRRALGLIPTELATLIAIYVLSAERPTTIQTVGALVERVDGYSPSTVNQCALRLERLGLVARLPKKLFGSVGYRMQPRGVQKLLEWSGAHERRTAAAE